MKHVTELRVGASVLKDGAKSRKAASNNPALACKFTYMRMRPVTFRFAIRLAG